LAAKKDISGISKLSEISGGAVDRYMRIKDLPSLFELRQTSLCPSKNTKRPNLSAKA